MLESIKKKTITIIIIIFFVNCSMKYNLMFFVLVFFSISQVMTNAYWQVNWTV